MRNKATAVLLALVMALFVLTGCTKTANEVITLYDSNGLKIEREGIETRIYDLEGEAEYSFISRRVKKDTSAAAQISEARTTADTDTITIQTVHNFIIVTSKTTETTLYIKGAR